MPNPPVQGSEFNQGEFGDSLFNAPAPASRLHPTEKPQALLRYLIGKLAPESVLDPFGGSCATLLAAADLGVKSIGIEIDERNCERAAQRLQDRATTPFLPFGEAS